MMMMICVYHHYHPFNTAFWRYRIMCIHSDFIIIIISQIVSMKFCCWNDGNFFLVNLWKRSSSSSVVFFLQSIRSNHEKKLQNSFFLVLDIIFFCLHLTHQLFSFFRTINRTDESIYRTTKKTSHRTFFFPYKFFTRNSAHRPWNITFFSLSLQTFCSFFLNVIS